MRRNIWKLAVVCVVTTFLVLGALPANAIRKAIVTIDGNNPATSQDYSAIPATAIWTTTPAQRHGPFYVGDISTGEVAVTEFTVPGFLTGDPQLSFARCTGTSGVSQFPWCDNMELVVTNIPKGRPWQADIFLTWPGKERVDPDTGKTTKLNNLDLYFYQDTHTVYVFENSGVLGNVDENNPDDVKEETGEVQANEVDFGSGALARGASRTTFHPEQITLADIPASRERVALPIPGRILLGGPTVLEQNGDFESTPTCPLEIQNDPELQPKLCPKITEVFSYYIYYLLVISRTHTNEFRNPEQTINQDMFNQGYTISTKLEVVPEDEAPDLTDNFISYDLDTNTFRGGLSPAAAKEAEGLPPVKVPGVDGPLASHELLALKGATSEPRKTAPIVPAAIGILLGGAVLFLGFKLWGRRRTQGAI